MMICISSFHARYAVRDYASYHMHPMHHSQCRAPKRLPLAAFARLFNFAQCKNAAIHIPHHPNGKPDSTTRYAISCTNAKIMGEEEPAHSLIMDSA